MRIIVSILFLFFLFTHNTYSSNFTEVKIVLENNIEGKLVTPHNTKSAVLLLHGYQGYMDDVGEIFKKLAHELAKHDVASLRFNFRGEGIRENYVVTSTINSRLEDSENAYKYLKKSVNNKPIGVLGFSLGGLTAIVLAGKNTNWFDSMVVWSSSNDGIGFLVTRDAKYNKTIREVVEKGQATWQAWDKLTITRKFLLGLLGYDAFEWLQKYKGPFLTIRGDKDYLPKIDNDWLKVISNKKKKYVEIKNADHIFNVLDTVKTKEKEVINHTIAWFINTLHL